MTLNFTREHAESLDNSDSIGALRSEFNIPKSNDGNEWVYLCGNSLGLQPRQAKNNLEVELEDWANLGVEGHFDGRKPWFHYHKFLNEQSAEIVGAQANEVVVMNQLTVNLHLLFVSFYRPKGKRYKILMEAGAFPSDMYVVESQVAFHNYRYEDAVIELQPRNGEFTLRDEDIINAIKEYGDELALVFFSGVQYYTGQCFDIEAITLATHSVGAIAGFDLAHAAGNIELQLHNWGVDFAAWCSYKYLNSGPGNVSGVFVHEKHGLNPNTPRFAGWWGHKEDVRFQMKRGYIPESGAAGWQLSNAPVLGMAVKRASLDVFSKVGMQKLTSKTALMTPYLRALLEEAKSINPYLDFQIITPDNAKGCQLSLLFGKRGKELFDFLASKYIVCDWREPNVIRMAPVPLYNSFLDCWKVGNAFREFVITR
jgi:kynureninase